MAVYELKRDPEKLSFLFGKDVPPVLRIQSGDEVIFHTEDALYAAVSRRDDKYTEAMKNIPVTTTNPLTGPVYVEDAQPGDVLKVTIKSITFDRNWGVSIINPSLVVPPSMLGWHTFKPLPEKTYIWELTEDGKHFYEPQMGMTVPAQPFMGTMGVAPPVDTMNALLQGIYGGNMDCEDICPGNTVYFPVYVPGALFATGDCHGRQGHGEINGTPHRDPGLLPLPV